MFSIIEERSSARRRAITAIGPVALAAISIAAFAPGSSAQETDSILKRGAKILGFATDLGPPADFVAKSRPPGELDFIPVFQPPPEPARPVMKENDLKAVRRDLDSVQKQHDVVRLAFPPSAKALAEEQAAAKKKAQSSAPGATQSGASGANR